MLHAFPHLHSRVWKYILLTEILMTFSFSLSIGWQFQFDHQQVHFDCLTIFFFGTLLPFVCNAFLQEAIRGLMEFSLTKSMTFQAFSNSIFVSAFPSLVLHLIIFYSSSFNLFLPHDLLFPEFSLFSLQFPHSHFSYLALYF